LTEIGHQPEDKETIEAKGTTEATTSEGRGTTTDIKETVPKTPIKGMQPLLETPQMHASNVEKWDTSPGTAQNAAKVTNTTTQLT